MDINRLRKEYELSTLSSKKLKENPFEQFMIWIEEAWNCNIIEPNAFVLATANSQGIPSSRTVLLKEFKEDEFVFYTNYESRKSQEIIDNPHVSITTYWKELERQVTIEGIIEKISEERSELYFASRSRESQLSAWSSKQGKPIASRSELLEEYDRYEKEFEGKKIPKPPFWGGFKLIPNCYFFWQGRANRLHDRFRYLKKVEGVWVINRLSP